MIHYNIRISTAEFIRKKNPGTGNDKRKNYIEQI